MTPAEEMQAVFSQVLEQAGRAGYASVDPAPKTGSLAEGMSAAWDNWFDQVARKWYSFEFDAGNPSVRMNKTAEDLKEDYKRILVQAYQNDAYRNPLDYVKKLSTSDLQAIQQVQSLADPIDISRLSDEGAINLLLPPDAHLDSDKDGLTSVGVADTIRFPDSNTPKNIREAWEVSTASLSSMDRAFLSLQMFSAISDANRKFDMDGSYLGSFEPGDAKWVNPTVAAGFSYLDFVSRKIESIERFKGSMLADEYQKQISFWATFREELERRPGLPDHRLP
jgi:hypothetical protein